MRRHRQKTEKRKSKMKDRRTDGESKKGEENALVENFNKICHLRNKKEDKFVF